MPVIYPTRDFSLWEREEIERYRDFLKILSRSFEKDRNGPKINLAYTWLQTLKKVLTVTSCHCLHKLSYCGKIGFLPNGHVSDRARASGTNLCLHINCWRNIFLTQTRLEGWQKEWIFLSKVCNGRFHDILPKEYSGTFPELLWGGWNTIKWDAY
jgi:hypothetical protein